MLTRGSHGELREWDLQTMSGREKLFSALNPRNTVNLVSQLLGLNNLIYVNHSEKCLAHINSSVYVYCYIYQSEVYTNHYIGKLSEVASLASLPLTPNF